MTTVRTAIFAALGLGAAVTTGHATNDLSSASRANVIAPPSIEGSSSSSSGAVGVNQGRASYSIPIAAPPGRAGLEPNLALGYGGILAEGEAGAGWSLAVPRIAVRTTGRGGQPSYGVSVVYRGFSGDDLVEIGTVADVDGDGAEETAFREERDLSFIRYLAQSGGGWRAQFPDGRELTLGVDPADRIARSGNATWIAEWLPETLSDASGNELVYTWNSAAALDPTAVSPTARYLTEIRYGCASCDTAASYQQVKLTWARRVTARFDFSTSFGVETEFLLATIETATVTAGTAAPVRVTTLGYDTAGPRPLLTSVALAAADGTALPPAVFTYTDGDAPSPTMTALASPVAALKSGVQIFDFDLDGRTDVVDLSTVAGAKWFRNTGVGGAAFAPISTAISSPPGQALSAAGTTSLDDATRDVAMDVFSLGVSRLYAHDGVGGWNTAGELAVLPAIAWSSNTLRFDVDGDGNNDLVDTSVTPWVVYLDDTEHTYTADVIVCTGGTPTFGAALRASSDGVLSGDVNGDGFVDIVYVSTAKTDAHVYYGRGRGCWGLLPEDGHGATSYVTFPITSAVSGPTRNATSLVDVTGDGLDDLVMFDATAARVNAWRFSPATGWSDAGMGGPFIQSITATNGCRAADVDGDGTAEAICTTGSKVYDWAARPVGLLASAANGIGVTTAVTYTTSAAVAAQHAAAGHAWDRNVGTALTIVGATETADGRGNVLVTTYDYHNAAMEVDELAARAEFAGFEYIAATAVPNLEFGGTRTIDPQDPGSMTRTWYDLGLDDELDWYRHGFTVCVETRPATPAPASYLCGDETGALLRVESTYTPEDVDGAIYTVVLDARDEHVLEGQPTGAHLRTTYDHDAYGNVIATYAYGRWDGAVDGFGDDEQAALTDYILDDVAWNLRLPKRTRIGALDTTGGIPAIEAEQISYLRYDGAAGWDVSTVGAGLRTATDRWTSDPISGIATTDAVETIVYTASGLPDLVTDAAGFVTDSDYDAALDLFKVRDTVDPGGVALVTEYSVDARTGVVTAVTDPDGTVATATYDLLGRMTTMVKPGDTALAPTLTRSYVDAAPVSTVTEVRRDGTADGLVSTSTLDGHGRLLCSLKEATAGKVDALVQREHSAAGRVVVDWLPTRTTACEALTLSAAGRGATRGRDEVIVDALGRSLRRSHKPSGSFRTWTYAPLAVTEADEEDTVPAPNIPTPVTRALDGRGRIIAVTETIDTNGDGTPDPIVTAYQWTALDLMESVVDPLGATVFAAQYDSRGRRVWSSDPDRGELVTTWDGMDRVATTLDARGATVAYAYDAAGRVATTVATDDDGSASTTTHHYDAPAPGYSAAACKYTRGRLAYVEDATGRTVTCYDANGHAVRIDKKIDALGPTALRLDRTFDTLDRIRTLRHPDGSTLTWSYGKDGRESKLTLKGSTAAGAATVTVVSAATYNGGGQPLSIGLGNGSTLAFSYDDRLRPARLAARTGATTHQDLGLVLDGIGNLEAIVDAEATHLSATFTYDALGRLTSATGDRFGGHTAGYAYDLRGNLIAKTSTDTGSVVDVGAITYRTDLIHAVDSVGGEVFAYDDAGNLVQDGALTYDYDAFGRLAQVASGGAQVMTNRYDHAQRRVVKDSATGTDVYYFPEAGLEIRGTTHVKQLAFAGRPVLRFTDTFTTAAGAAAQGRFLVTDHLGAPTLVLDGVGAVVERWAAHPHGEDNPDPIVSSGHAADFRAYDDPTTVLEHRFQGREINAEDGSYDFGARVYRADLGRFMSPDTVIPDPGSSQSWNRYAFARNNPLGFVDPTGHTETSVTTPVFEDQAQVDEFASDLASAYGMPAAQKEMLTDFLSRYIGDTTVQPDVAHGFSKNERSATVGVSGSYASEGKGGSGGAGATLGRNAPDTFSIEVTKMEARTRGFLTTRERLDMRWGQQTSSSALNASAGLEAKGLKGNGSLTSETTITGNSVTRASWRFRSVSSYFQVDIYHVRSFGRGWRDFRTEGVMRSGSWQATPMVDNGDSSLGNDWQYGDPYSVHDSNAFHLYNNDMKRYGM